MIMGGFTMFICDKGKCLMIATMMGINQELYQV